MAATVVLLMATGYVISFPVDNFMLGASACLIVASVAGLLMINYFADSSSAEIARLREELQKKSDQIVELVEVEREEDRIIESLSEKVSQVRNTLLSVQAKHASERQQIPGPAAETPDRGRTAAAFNHLQVLEHPKLYTPEEFQTIANQYARIARRYDRYFTIIRIRTNSDERRQAIGEQASGDEFAAAVETITKELRTSDFASLEGPDSMLVAYPETSPVHLDAILGKLRSALALSTAREIRIEIDQSTP